MIKGFIKQTARGFTLIELLVVIAIIGILAGIVLASLNNARQGAGDAKTKEQLSGLRTAMEIFYSTNEDYGGASATCGALATNVPVAADLVDTNNYPGQTITCGGSDSAWAASVTLNDTTNGAAWCVDSTGHSAAGAASANNATVCP